MNDPDAAAADATATMTAAGAGAGSRAQAVVALGGGHGLFASLSALRLLVDDLTVDALTAIVTVADNGGSSGRLRGEFNVLPPGDLRMALAALCGQDDWGVTWSQVLQHRFEGSGDMRGHVIGNLLIVGLWEHVGDPVGALDWVGRLLGTKGRVLPMALCPMDITAQVRGPGDDAEPRTVRGQVEVATAEGRIEAIRLEPEDPPVSAAAIDAIHAADWVVLGPGSWFTSVIPHLMVPALRRAIVETSARLVVVLNLAAQEDETPDFAPADHLAVLAEHAPDLRVHTVLADAAGVLAAGSAGSAGDPAGGAEDRLRAAAEALGARLVLADLAVGDGTPRHDPARLAAAYERLVTGG